MCVTVTLKLLQHHHLVDTIITTHILQKYYTYLIHLMPVHSDWIHLLSLTLQDKGRELRLFSQTWSSGGKLKDILKWLVPKKHAEVTIRAAGQVMQVLRTQTYLQEKWECQGSVRGRQRDTIKPHVLYANSQNQKMAVIRRKGSGDNPVSIQWVRNGKQVLESDGTDSC